MGTVRGADGGPPTPPPEISDAKLRELEVSAFAREVIFTERPSADPNLLKKRYVGPISRAWGNLFRWLARCTGYKPSVPKEEKLFLEAENFSAEAIKKKGAYTALGGDVEWSLELCTIAAVRDTNPTDFETDVLDLVEALHTRRAELLTAKRTFEQKIEDAEKMITKASDTFSTASRLIGTIEEGLYPETGEIDPSSSMYKDVVKILEDAGQSVEEKEVLKVKDVLPILHSEKKEAAKLLPGTKDYKAVQRAKYRYEKALEVTNHKLALVEDCQKALLQKYRPKMVGRVVELMKTDPEAYLVEAELYATLDPIFLQERDHYYPTPP